MQRGLLWEGTLTLSPPHLPMAGACGRGCAAATGLGDAHTEPMKSLQGCGQRGEPPCSAPHQGYLQPSSSFAMSSMGSLQSRMLPRQQHPARAEESRTCPRFPGLHPRTITRTLFNLNTIRVVSIISTMTPQLPPSPLPTLTQPCCCSLLLPQVQGWVREVLAVSPWAAEAADTADSSGTRLHSLLLTGTVGGVPSHKLQWRCAQHTHPGKQHRVLLAPEPAFVGYSSNDSARDDGKL